MTRKDGGCVPVFYRGGGNNYKNMSEILITDQPITIAKIKEIASQRMGDMVKIVVDLSRGKMALGGEMHADEEQLLLEDGSKQNDLWGINIYPDLPVADRIEFDSMINIRPRQNNRSRSVEDEQIREQILALVGKLIVD